MTIMPDDRRGSQPMTPWQAWLSMFGIRAPLSGDVTQDITSSIGGQLGLLNINATRSGDSGLEQRIITQVASYGRQLGRLVEAVDVLARQQPRHDLDAADLRALDLLQELAEQIAACKEQKALEDVDRIVTEVQALSRHPKTNVEAIRRVRAALPEQRPPRASHRDPPVR